MSLYSMESLLALHKDIAKLGSSFIQFSLMLRSGAVCLDVINQTWSPMFGKQCLKNFIICLLAMHFILSCFVTATKNLVIFLIFFQTLLMCLRCFFLNFFCIPMHQIHWTVMLLPWWSEIVLHMNKESKVVTLSVV